MFVAPTSVFCLLLVGSDAFVPSKLARETSLPLQLSFQSSVAERVVKEEKEIVEVAKEVDISIPYDATVLLAYDSSDKSLSYDEFKPKYLSDAVAYVVAKQPVDVSIPYEATIQLAYAASDRSISYEEFKPKYLTEAVAEVVAKQPAVVSVETPSAVVSVETPSAVASVETPSASDDVQEAKKDEIVYYEPPVITKDDEEKEADPVVYFKGEKTLDEKEIYLWLPKTETEKDDARIRKKEREGKYTLKINQEKSIIVKNLDRTKPKTKPVKKKFTRLTKQEKEMAHKARQGRRVLSKVSLDKTTVIAVVEKTVAEEKATAFQMDIKKKVVMNTDSEGLFAPAVLLTRDIMGITELNKLRGKIIKIHSTVIGDFTQTAQSEFGNQVLKVLFSLADENGDGTIDEEELTRALKLLGFDFLKEKEIAQIFNKADGDKSGALDFEEWQKAAPMALKKNLIKLAKKNGHELGFLAK